jgi:hypothetical protein
MNTKVIEGLIDTYEMRTGNTTTAAREQLASLKTRLAEAERIMARLDEYGSLNIDNGDNLYDIIDAARAFWRPEEPK